MRIHFYTHYFTPEGNAPANRVFEMTRRWVRAGHEVTVVTGVPNVPAGVAYEGYRNRWRQEERVEGIRVVRVWTYLAANRGVVRRSLNYLSYLLTASRAGASLEKPDVLIATSPQFFCGWAGAIAARRLGAPFVLEVRDLWPESIEAVRAVRGRWIIRRLERLEHALYRRAAHIVTVGEGYRTQLLQRGVEPARVSVIPSGVDLQAFGAQEPDREFLAQRGLAGHFVCAYVGTIGLACGLDVVLRAAKVLERKGRADIRFLLVGDGAVRADLERQAREAGTGCVVFTGRLSRGLIPGVLASSDACLVHLKKKELFRTVLPTKIFEAAAMRRPILLGVEGDAASVVDGAGAGICFEPENEDALAAAVLRLADDPGLRSRLGQAGYEKIARQYSYDTLAPRYLEVLEREAGRREEGNHG
jgi:hypothetical protein